MHAEHANAEVKWSSLRGRGVILHFCHDSLIGSLRTDVKARFNIEPEVEKTSHVSLDLPGMQMMDAGWQDISLDGLLISIPYNDFGSLYTAFKAAKLREFVPAGLEYYKLHTGNNRCLVVTPEQRDLLLAEMEKLVPFCEKMAEDETAEIIRRLQAPK